MTISTASFNDRLARIEKSHVKSKGKITLHVGDQEMRVRADSAMLRGAIAEPKRSRLRVLAVLPALMTGMAGFALMTGLKMRFLTSELADALGPSPALALFGAAVFLALMIGLVLRMFSVRLMLWQVIGAAIALVSLHNLAFWQPGLSSVAFTPDWVEQQTAAMEPRTLAYGETKIHF